MSNTRVFTDPRSQHFKSDGVSSNSSGKLYFREPGSGSTTLKAIYSDKELSVQLLNPVTLDSNGRAPEIFLDGDYSVEMTDSSDVQIWRIDNYQPPEVEGQFAEWGSTFTYAVNDYVRYTDGNYYVSLRSGNVGNVPSSSTTYWSQAFFITVYNASKSYSVGDLIYYDGNLYTSLTNSNRGNTPSTSFDDWRRPGVSVPVISGYVGNIIKYFRTDVEVSPLILTGLMSNNVWHSIGPTGSGADTEWDLMSELPSNAVSVTLSFASYAERETGTSLAYSINLSTRTNGLTNAFLVSDTGDFGSSTEPSASRSAGVFEVPISSSNIFDMKYQETNTDSINISLILVGFSVEES